MADALLGKPLGPLPPEEAFLGAGVYAVYYKGSFPSYRPISLDANPGRETPIYVGKAVPAGARRGGFSLDVEPGTVLYGRLTEHADSIRQVENLEISDFLCRYLVVDDIWIPLGESLLIQMFSPLWNRVLVGFGNHDPGKGRYQGKMPPWDVLHPGRRWADNLQPSTRTADDLLHLIGEYFAAQPAP